MQVEQALAGFLLHLVLFVGAGVWLFLYMASRSRTR